LPTSKFKKKEIFAPPKSGAMRADLVEAATISRGMPHIGKKNTWAGYAAILLQTVGEGTLVIKRMQ
jgi:hypothetical protein